MILNCANISLSSIRKSIFLILSFIFILSGYSINAQSIDSSSIELRVPSDERLTEINGDKQYFYAETKKELSFWDRFIIWLRSVLGEWIQNKYVEIFLKITAGIAFALVLFLFINQISKGELKNALTRRNDRSILNLSIKTSDNNRTDFDLLLNDALQNKDYTLAVRFLYQKSIQLLQSKELITLKADKTNHDLLSELSNHPAANSFNRLTYFYEYVDYGDFKIDELRFRKIESVFNQFKKEVAEA